MPRPSLGRLRSALELGANAFVMVACGVMLWTVFAKPTSRVRAPDPVPTSPVPLNNAEILGRPDALVAIVEYSDFQCPFCGKFVAQVFPQLKRQYVETGKVFVAFRQFPLEAIHSHATKAAEAAKCAAQSGRFWEMHDSLFANQANLDEPSLLKRGRELGLDEASFSRCLNGEMAESVRRDVSSGKVLKVTGTPTFLIGRVKDGKVTVLEVLSGAQPLDRFQSALDKALRMN